MKYVNINFLATKLHQDKMSDAKYAWKAVSIGLNTPHTWENPG